MQIIILFRDYGQSNSSFNLNSNNESKTKDPNNINQSIMNSTIEAKNYQAVKALEHQMESKSNYNCIEELGLNKDSSTLIVLFV